MVLGNTDFMLDGLPTTFIPPHEKNDSSVIFIGNTDPMVASALVCDFGPRVFPASVTLANGSLSILSRLPVNHTNNIHPHWINNIFVDSFVVSMIAGKVQEMGDLAGISDVASATFVDMENKKLLSINEIKYNLNMLLLSVAKPYLDGKVHISNLERNRNSNFSGVHTNATVGLSRNILVDSRPFLSALLAVVIIVLVLLIVLIVLVEEEHFLTFDLKNIVKVANHIDT